ncbi:MAG: CRISPR-associated protein Cas4 [Desulfosalsimonadaceae bacterium]
MIHSEDDLIQLSALQHLIFCPRQCALIHIEQVWTENIFTAEGRLMHERAHEGGSEVRGDVRTDRGLAIRSLRLGLSGIADVVEFHRQPDGSWLPFPVEYKLGKPKADDCDTVQLCAQAMCLEEMLNVAIPNGALFYGKTRRRLDVVFDSRLRDKTEETARAVHALLESGITPEPVYAKKCDSCSLIAQCLPKTMGKHRSVKRYLAKSLFENPV